MATVYLARDVKHRRAVALKVLKPELGAVLGVERFLAEIQVTANLQHPNLLPLFDSGEAAGLLFYVMPFVEGESLRARLDREKQLPVDEAVRLSVAIAGALEYAHQHGVIHRDLKPENILLQAGQPVIADFGIALAVSNAGGARVTQTGLSLGTPQYMSPEQATGDRAIDARTDVYSLAAMTYEMLTGEPPHTGTTAQAIIAKLMTEDVRPLTVLRRSVPPHVDAAVRHGLQKLAADRFASAAEFSLALTGARPIALPAGTVTAASGVAGGVAMSKRMRALVAALALVAVSSSAIAVWQSTRATPTPPRMQFDIILPDSVDLFNGGGTKVALSRDGRQLAFAGTRAGVAALYIRRLDDAAAPLVPGTDQRLNNGIGMNPRFSPNGESLLFSTLDGLRMMPVAGGIPRTVADSGVGGADWVDAQRVIYTKDRALWLWSPEGKGRQLLSAPDTAQRVFALKWPAYLPGGTHALVTIDRSRVANVLDSLRLGVVSLEDGSVTDLGVDGTNAYYVASGHLVFGRVGGVVLSAPFSLRTRQITGSAVRVLEGVWQGGGGATGFAVSDNSTLAYHAGSSSRARELVIVNRSGAARRVPGEVSDWTDPRLSPDDARIVAVNAGGTAGFRSDLWLRETATGAVQRLADAGTGGRPAWSRDGSRVAYLRGTNDDLEIVLRSWDRSRADEVVKPGKEVYEMSLGPALGMSALRIGTGPRAEIFIAPTNSLSSARPYPGGRLSGWQPTVSADGRFLAYTSSESTRPEVFVVPLPGPGPRLQVSVEGGSNPVWSKRGSTLFFRSSSHAMAAEIGGTPPRVVKRERLFVDIYFRNNALTSNAWDVFASGEEFLMLREFGREARALTMLVNWQHLPAMQKGRSESP
jgi:serine/threonine-protein kinase